MRLRSPIEEYRHGLITRADLGYTVDQLAKHVSDELGKSSFSSEDIRLLVEHVLGRRTDSEIAHLCPALPTGVEYGKRVEDGHLLFATGGSSGDYYAMVTTNIEESEMRRIIREHSEDFCKVIYRKAHTTKGAHREGVFAHATVSYSDICQLE